MRPYPYFTFRALPVSLDFIAQRDLEGLCHHSLWEAET